MRESLVDAWTVAQKELRELIATRRSSPVRMLVIAATVLILGVVLPLLAGPRWLDSAWLLSLWAWVPVFIVATVVADSVAGERERHTLETLLASPLPDRAILLGKVAAAVIYGWGLMFITIIASIVAINLVYARDQLMLYKPLLLLCGGLLSFLTTVLAAAIGVLVSLRARSVRRAQQIIAFGLAATFLAHLALSPALHNWLPAGMRLTFDGVVSPFESLAVVGVLALLLLVINALLLHTAILWFRRCRLHTN